MKDIIFIYPAVDFEDNYPCSWIPYSVLSIASVNINEKFRVHIFDENRIQANNIYEFCKKLDVFILGLSIMTGGGQIKRALSHAKYFKERYPGIFTVFGGPHVNVLPEQTAKNEYVDFAISGPGQEVFYELADMLYQGISIRNLDGIYYHKNGKICLSGKPKASIKKLYAYDFKLIDSEMYIRYDATIADRTLNYIASQGCPYACRFCYECSYERKYITMDIGNIRRDIALFAEQYGVTGIKFYDADFFVDSGKAGIIMDILRKYNLSWAASIHPKDIIRHNKAGYNSLLRKVKETKCKRLLMGMESGNDHVLKDIIKKHVITAELLETAVQIAEYGILGSYTFMVGYPDETRTEQEETFRFIQKLLELHIPIETKVHIYLPYPGTPLYDRAVELGFCPPDKLEDWSEFNYYKAMTPWTDSVLEQRIKEFTKMIDKNKSDTDE